MPTIVSSVEELCFNVSQIKHSLSFESTMSVNDIESRLDLIFRYTSKYNVMTLHELCNVEKELNKKIQSIATYQDTLKKLEKKRESCKEQLLKKSAVLTNARKNFESHVELN